MNILSSSSSSKSSNSPKFSFNDMGKKTETSPSFPPLGKLDKILTWLSSFFLCFGIGDFLTLNPSIQYTFSIKGYFWGIAFIPVSFILLRIIPLSKTLERIKKNPSFSPKEKIYAHIKEIFLWLIGTFSGIIFLSFLLVFVSKLILGEL